MQTNQQQVQVVKRGCGWPRQGKTYAYVPSDGRGNFGGLPIWNFLLCTPVQVPDPAGFGINSLGMALKSRGTCNKDGKEIFDVYDWIGEHNYPNVLDWVMEVALLGFHQLVNEKQMAQLVPESLYFGLHANAWIDNPVPYYENRQSNDLHPVCPQNHDVHVNLTRDFLDMYQTCSGLYTNDIVGGKMIGQSREVVRKMPSFEYAGWRPPVDNPAHTPAIFFRLPIGMMARFLVYEDTKDNAHEEALKELENLDAKLQRVNVVKL